MKRTLRRHRLSCIVGMGTAGVAVLLLARAIADGRPPPKAPPPPPAPANAVRVDRPKNVIEFPQKRLLARQTAPAPGATIADFVNPKVQPGKVRWHKDFETACGAAKKSGKPVLLFQMMGKLDDRFC